MAQRAVGLALCGKRGFAVAACNPSIAYWRDHSAGASRRRMTPTPRGSRPSTAAFTSSGARNASEIVILTCRMLQFSRAAICSTLVTVPVTISSSQRRPRAIASTSVARVSARTGRRSGADTDPGTMSRAAVSLASSSMGCALPLTSPKLLWTLPGGPRSHHRRGPFYSAPVSLPGCERGAREDGRAWHPRTSFSQSSLLHLRVRRKRHQRGGAV